jgi:anti-sigma factor RsiW
MMITRDVVYDLLPAYFADEASPDTRALVDEFLKSDPEFARMMERFKKIMDEREAGTSASAKEKDLFDRARALQQKESELRGYVVAFALAALFVPAVILLGGRQMRLPFWVMSAAFVVTAAISWVQLYCLRRDAGGRGSVW